VPAVLEALLSHDEAANEQYGQLTDDKKRNLTHMINKFKDINKQAHTMLTFLTDRNIGVGLSPVRSGQKRCFVCRLNQLLNQINNFQ